MLEGELDRLVPLCAKSAVAAASAEHRTRAVTALDAVPAYPYHLLHPFRSQVVPRSHYAEFALSLCRRDL